MAAAHPSLAISGVSYSFGQRRVLNDVSFAVQAGRVTLLLGPNGAGKTTLFSLITGLLAPQAGQITLPGKGRADMAIVFQQPALDLDLTIRQNLAFHAGLHGLTWSAAKSRLAPLLQQLELGQRMDDKARILNGGHRRRVEIIRALMTEPAVLLLDEPTAGLDASTRKSLVAFLHLVAAERNMAMLWATHLPDEAAAGDDVAVLHEGRLRAAGNLGEVLAQTGAATLEEAFLAITHRAAA